MDTSAPTPLTLDSWFAWLRFTSAAALAALVVCYLALALRYGPLAAGDRLYSALLSAARDLWNLSPRRTAAIAWLAVKESVRKQAAAGLVIFVLILAFALWFLDQDSLDPSALYVSFLLSACNYLILVMAVVTSAFSLPNDLKNKTIYTIVTKPVRAGEIVLGRILGFALVCTVPLMCMGLGSYFFLTRALDHRHELRETDLATLDADEATAEHVPPGSKAGITSVERNHRHRVVVDPSGNGITETNDASKLALDDSSSFLERFGQSHRHRVTAVERDGRTTYELGPPEGQFQARVPIEGSLRFITPQGNVTTEGTNVGNWTNRGYVAGSTLAAAVYRFSNVTPATFPDGLRLMMNIRLFRTTKEGLDKPILGSVVVRNPYTRAACAPRNFAAREYFTVDLFLPRTLSDASGNSIDLFRDLVVNQEVEIELQCIPRSQYFGVGPKDVYLLAREASFAANFAKGFVGIWLQMLLAVSLGVFFSTFLSGPVAMLATGAALVGAVLKPALLKIVEGRMYGENVHSSGMLESMVRLAQQKAVMQEMEKGATTDAILWFDRAMNGLLGGVFRFVPDFSAMKFGDLIAQGLDVAPAAVSGQAWQALGFLLPLFVIGFLIFKSIEIAKS